MRVWTAPDLSVTITAREAEAAMVMFWSCDWDKLEAGIPDGAKDVNGVLLDRNNRNVKLAVLAECVAGGRGVMDGSGIDLMNNPHYEFAINTLLDAMEDDEKRNGKP